MESSLRYWFIPLFPTILKKLMVWSGTNYTGNSMWTFLCWMEFVAIILGIMSLGVRIGWGMLDRDDKRFDKFKHEHTEKLSKMYRELFRENVPLEKKIAELESDLRTEQWKCRQLTEALQEEKHKKIRTPEEANKEALKELV